MQARNRTRAALLLRSQLQGADSNQQSRETVFSMPRDLQTKRINKRLVYEGETHRYTCGGRVVPSVTQVLQHAGIADHSFVPQEALQRGTDVHTAIDHCLGDTTLMGFVADNNMPKQAHQAMKFLRNVNAKVIAFEEVVFDRKLWYCGRLDLIAEIYGFVFLIDWKCNSLYKSACPQLAAYARAWNAAQKTKKRRIQKIGAVILKANSYQLVESTGPLWPTDYRTDEQTFLKARKEYKRKLAYEHLKTLPIERPKRYDR